MEKPPSDQSREERTPDEQKREELDEKLDEAIEMTFPASDPIALHPREGSHASE